MRCDAVSLVGMGGMWLPALRKIVTLHHQGYVEICTNVNLCDKAEGIEITDELHLTHYSAVKY